MTIASVSYCAPTPLLARQLLPAARRIFTETFGARYDPAPFADFCDTIYEPGGRMDVDLHAPDVLWRVAVVDDRPIGYAKLTPLRAPVANPAPGAMELQQLYVLEAWHGTGVADALMHWAIAIASGHAASELYLTVFDHNQRAKRFYARHGFSEVGRCTFQLGDRIDDDRIWRRSLIGEDIFPH